MADVVIAAAELARASLAFRFMPTDRLRLLSAPLESGRGKLSQRQRALIERVAYIVPIMGLRVPWRSDCVVQALAARRWLARGNVQTALCIGVRKEGADLAAHAWLKAGDRIVTGGDISTYTELPPLSIDAGLFA